MSTVSERFAVPTMNSQNYRWESVVPLPQLVHVDVRGGAAGGQSGQRRGADRGDREGVCAAQGEAAGAAAAADAGAVGVLLRTFTLTIYSTVIT